MYRHGHNAPYFTERAAENAQEGYTVLTGRRTFAKDTLDIVQSLHYPVSVTPIMWSVSEVHALDATVGGRVASGEEPNVVAFSNRRGR